MRQLKISKSITNRESQSIEKYLLEIGKEELITAEEEVQLARKSVRVINAHWISLRAPTSALWYQ
jgi:hypothetical protein